MTDDVTPLPRALVTLTCQAFPVRPGDFFGWAELIRAILVIKQVDHVTVYPGPSAPSLDCGQAGVVSKGLNV